MSADTVRGLVAAAIAQLRGEESEREAELLLGLALGRDRAWLYAHRADAVAPPEAVRFHELLARRGRGEPLAYILGRREFWSLDLGVTPDVLIPRPETELLVELALRQVPQDAQVEIADLGTGSGAIALALARERPRAHVLATDASDAALAIAHANATRLGLGNVEFAPGDWCAALGHRRFDMIVSNPPYIAAGDTHLGDGDLRFEPRAALVSGVDGLDAIRRIVRDAAVHLHPGGWLLLEHGFDQGAAVRALLRSSRFEAIATHRDLESRERASVARVPGG